MWTAASERPGRDVRLRSSRRALHLCDDAEVPGARAKIPEYRFSITLRPKGPFGLTHAKSSRGSRSARIFLTVPLSFWAMRAPAAGLDLNTSKAPRAVQLTSLTTGLLLSFEPWDYVQGKNMYGVPFRGQIGALFSNWYKGQFQPSLYAGIAITLPVFRGVSQLDTDVALGFGWEVDLRRGYDTFGQRNHFLVTLGMNIFSLLGPQSSPRR